jgi:hypothetical protein
VRSLLILHGGIDEYLFDGVDGQGKVRRQCTYPVKWIPLFHRRWIRNHRWQAGEHGQRHRVGSNEQVREQEKTTGYYGTLPKGK